MLEVHSTKSFMNMPCAHAQFFDKNEDGTPGHCAALHGYDRSFHFVFSGTVDENGWLIPFGKLKPVKDFLEYYFDHTSVLPANDPRLDLIPDSMTGPGGIINTLRVLPYGVSMEMSSLFVWEYVNEYIDQITNGRVYVSRVEIKEHERNSAFITVDRKTARKDADDVREDLLLKGRPSLPQMQFWDFVMPKAAVLSINMDY